MECHLKVFLFIFQTHKCSKFILIFKFFSDADDAVHDMDGKDMQGGRVRVELARDPRDRRNDNRGGGNRGRFGGGGGGRNDDRRPRGNPPGPRTNYRLVVENLSSRTSWQVRISHNDFISKSCWLELKAYFSMKPAKKSLVSEFEFWSLRQCWAVGPIQI